jgi:hypothetical protein
MLPFVVLVAGCASSVESTTASGFIKSPDYATVFRNVTSASVGAGFAILSTSPETGHISAIHQESHVLSGADPQIEIALTRENGGVALQVTMATETKLGGVVSAGNPRSTLSAFCSALTDVLPDATCSVQAKKK